MISIKTQSILPSGKVRRRYQVIVTDLQGNEHTEVLGMFNHEPSNDGLQVEQDFLASKKLQEIELYKGEIRAGKNPFNKSPLWNSRSELLKPILDDALSLDANDPIVYNGVQYLSLVTDEEFKVLYGENQEWVDSVRKKAQLLLLAKNDLDYYEAVL